MTSSAWAKLHWANEHLECLQAEVGAYSDSDKCLLRFETDQQRHRHTAFIQLNEAPPLERWALKLADCLHNARASLDHAMWTLTDHGPDVRDTSTQFPVFSNRQAFRNNGKRYMRAIPPASRRSRAIIQWLQPYRRRDTDGDVLSLLHALDITDKHKTLSLHLIRPGSYEFEYEMLGDSHIEGAAWVTANDLAFEDGAYVGHLEWERTYRDSAGEAEMNVKTHLAVDVAFGEGVPARLDGYPVIPFTQRALRRVETILAALVPE
jgi:hypothetical protein